MDEKFPANSFVWLISKSRNDYNLLSQIIGVKMLNQYLEKHKSELDQIIDPAERNKRFITLFWKDLEKLIHSSGDSKDIKNADLIMQCIRNEWRIAYYEHKTKHR